MMNETDLEDTELILIDIRNSLRDIDLKLDHLIRTYNKRFFEVDDPKRSMPPEG